MLRSENANSEAVQLCFEFSRPGPSPDEKVGKAPENRENDGYRPCCDRYEFAWSERSVAADEAAGTKRAEQIESARQSRHAGAPSRVGMGWSKARTRSC